MEDFLSYLIPQEEMSTELKNSIRARQVSKECTIALSIFSNDSKY